MVSIVLTHWDKDHYYSAYKKNPAAQNCDWLVPRQWAAPFAVRFAAKLSKARCWPETMARNPYRFSVGRDRIIEICKCESFDPNDPAQDRNTHGLAVMIINKKASAGVEVMILPGDCHFDGIPGPPPPGAIRALVAYHHGSHAGWTSQTGPRIANRAQVFDMAYSFSARNSYGHPDRTNYQPDWHANSVETPDLRANGAPYVDFTW
jgi:hypothetical protein